MIEAAAMVVALFLLASVGIAIFLKKQRQHTEEETRRLEQAWAMHQARHEKEFEEWCQHVEHSGKHK